MRSRAAIAGHPLHPIFVTIPIDLWSFAALCDLVYLLGWAMPHSVIFVLGFAPLFGIQGYFGIVPVLLSFSGAGILGLSGWLGGELVSRFGISVYSDPPKTESSDVDGDD